MAGSLPKGIRRRGNSFHVDITRNGKRLNATCQSLLEARQKKAEFEHQLYSGKAVLEALKKRGKSWTLAEGVEYTARTAWSRAVTRDKMVKFGLEAVEFFGKNRPLNSITTEGVDHWVFELETKRLSDSSINQRIAVISKIMNVAMERGGLDAKPKMPRKHHHETRFRIVSKGEENRLLFILRQMGFDLQADAVVALLDTGMRVGELLKVHERDISLHDNYIHAWQSKTQAPRSIPMTRRVRQVVVKRLTGHPGNLVFPMRHYDLYKAWDRARARMNLIDDPHFTMHALRHTCASRLVMMGVNLRIVQDWMGHKAYESTLRYAHLVPETLEQAKLALEKFERREISER